MKKILLILMLMTLGGISYGQSKKDVQSEIDTNSPVYFYIYTGEEGDGAVEILIYDRKRQFVSMEYAILQADSKQEEQPDLLIKLINMPEVGALAYRQAESLEEARMEADGSNVLAVKLKELSKAIRIMY